METFRWLTLAMLIFTRGHRMVLSADGSLKMGFLGFEVARGEVLSRETGIRFVHSR